MMTMMMMMMMMVMMMNVMNNDGDNQDEDGVDDRDGDIYAYGVYGNNYADDHDAADDEQD